MDDMLLRRIEINPDILMGRPVISGTRIPVSVVLDLLSNDLQPGEIIDTYPDLTLKDIKAAVFFGSKLAFFEEPPLKIKGRTRNVGHK